MIVLLDSNTVIARLNGDAKVAERLRAHKPHQVLLGAPALAELVFGAHLSERREQNLRRLEDLAAGMVVVSFDQRAATRFGELKANLRRRGIVKSDFDLALMAIALELDATVISDDHAFHDGTVDGLRAENWLQTDS